MVCFFSSCQNGKKTEEIISSQEIYTLKVLLVNFRYDHHLNFPNNFDDLFNCDYYKFSDKQISDLKKNWTYVRPPEKEVKNIDSEFVVFEKKTSKGQFVRIRIRDVSVSDIPEENRSGGAQRSGEYDKAGITK